MESSHVQVMVGGTLAISAQLAGDTMPQVSEAASTTEI